MPLAVTLKHGYIHKHSLMVMKKFVSLYLIVTISHKKGATNAGKMIPDSEGHESKQIKREYALERTSFAMRLRPNMCHQSSHITYEHKSRPQRRKRGHAKRKKRSSSMNESETHGALWWGQEVMTVLACVGESHLTCGRRRRGHVSHGQQCYRGTGVCPSPLCYRREE